MATKKLTPAEPGAETPRRALVIGYGNELRGDDAVGPQVARRIDDLHLPGVAVVVRQQLLPELADDIAQADMIIFVDAERTRKVRTREVFPGSDAQVIAHSNTPEAMLWLTRSVFGRAPRAWLVTIPALHLGFRQSLSATTRRAAAQAVKEIAGLLSR